MKNRITTGYCPGSGDVGYSQLLDGELIRKDDPSCLIYSYLEQLANSISELLSYTKILDKELYTVLDYLSNNHFSISAFCFKKGDTVDHVIPQEFLDFITTSVDYFKSSIGASKDFLIQKHWKLVLLDKIRIWVRSVETAYITWMNHERVTTNLLNILRVNPEKAAQILANMDLVSSTLNRLSTYLWWATRHEFNLMKEVGEIWETETENYWQGKVMQWKSNTAAA